MPEPEVIDAEVVDDPTVAALAVRETSGSLLRPAAAQAEIEQAFHDYQALCESLLDDSDYQAIAGKSFKKKSAWRKLGTAFGVNHEKLEKNIDRDEHGNVLRAEFVYRAIAPNGRYQDGWGSCDLFEKCCSPGCTKNHRHCVADCPGSVHFSHPNHDIPATAETRAKNRASADLFGMGEVSAEEVLDAGGSQRRTAIAAPSHFDGPLSDYTCPAPCGAPLIDRRETKTGKQPSWKCSAGSKCKSKKGKFEWGSWEDDPTQDGAGSATNSGNAALVAEPQEEGSDPQQAAGAAIPPESSSSPYSIIEQAYEAGLIKQSDVLRPASTLSLQADLKPPTWTDLADDEYEPIVRQIIVKLDLEKRTGLF